MAARASTSQLRALHLLGLKGLCKARNTVFLFLFACSILIAAWAAPCVSVYQASGVLPQLDTSKSSPPWRCSVATLPAGLGVNHAPVCSSFPERLNPSEISGQPIQSDLQCTCYFCRCSRAELASACGSHVHDVANSKSTGPDLCLGCACPALGQIQQSAVMFPSQGPFSKKPYVLLFVILYVVL